MSQPFSEIPDPGAPRPFKRRFQPSVVQDMLRAALHTARRQGDAAVRAAKRHGQDLWYRGKRHPRTVGIIAGAIAVTFVGAYALSASGAGRSLCPKGIPKTQFLLLVDPVLNQAAGSEVDIHYDVCGLSSGTPYRGRVQLSQQKPAGKTGKKKVTQAAAAGGHLPGQGGWRRHPPEPAPGPHLHQAGQLHPRAHRGGQSGPGAQAGAEAGRHAEVVALTSWYPRSVRRATAAARRAAADTPRAGRGDGSGGSG